MSEYRVALEAFANVAVEADSDEEAVEKLNDAIANLDVGALRGLTVNYVETPDGGRWEQDEARRRGVSN